MRQEKKINEQIRDRFISLVDENNNFFEKMDTRDALSRAESCNLDLVEVTPSDGKKLTVCKLMDYGKIKYQQKKQNKSTHSHHTKEIYIGYNIDEHDLIVKHKKIRKLLEKGKSVKYIVRLNGREKRFIDSVADSVNNTLKEFEDIAVWEPAQRNSSNIVSTVLQPHQS